MKLNLGCGYHKPEGWINADIDPRVEPDVLVENYSLPWDDDTFDQVGIMQVLYHIPLEQVPVFLTEVKRVTAPGGQVMVICPDVRQRFEWFVTVENDSIGPSPRERPAYDHRGTYQQQTGWWTGNAHPNGRGDINSILHGIFAFGLVLEDDETGGIPRRGTMNWNVYGARLKRKMEEVFDSVELVERCLISDAYSGSRELLWTDPKTGREWATAGWVNHTCAAMADV